MALEKVRPVYVATGVVVAAYVATSGAAALIPFSFGQEQLAPIFFPVQLPFESMTMLGSATYWMLFLLTLVLLPIVALATDRLFVTRPVALPDEIPLWVPLALAGAMVAFCVFRLAQAGGLTASEAWDQSLCYQDKILRRVELFKLLGNRYYAFAYSSLPIIGCYLLARGLRRRETAGLAACAVVSLIILWLDVATIQKAPALLYVLVIGLTLALSGFGLVRSAIVTVAAGGAIYLALALSQFCTVEPKSWERVVLTPEEIAQQSTESNPLPRSLELTGQDLPAGSPSVSASPSAAAPPPASSPPAASASPSASVVADASGPQSPAGPPSSIAAPPPAAPPAAAGPPADEQDTMLDKGVRLLRSAAFRMAVGFPFYVQIFSDPAQRCGIVLPALGGLIGPRPCYPAIKVFAAIYPEIKYTTGYQPAGVSLSGYGEAGTGYAVLATVIAGVLIGLLSALARGRDPLSVALQVACCLYAYYVTQVPLTSTVLDSYGLIWLIAPLAAMLALTRIVGAAFPKPIHRRVIEP